MNFMLTAVAQILEAAGLRTVVSSPDGQRPDRGAYMCYGERTQQLR